MDNNALNIVSDAKILTRSDMNNLFAIIPELSKTFETVQVFRTKTEMRVSVLSDIKHPTPDSKYWQSVREQNVHFCELVNLSYEYRKNAVKIKQYKRKAELATNDLKREMYLIEVEQKCWNAKQMERVAHERIREITEWSKIKNELKPLLKYGDDEVDKHQLETMRLRFEREASLVNNHTPPADARNILGLNESVQREKMKVK